MKAGRSRASCPPRHSGILPIAGLALLLAACAEKPAPAPAPAPPPSPVPAPAQAAPDLGLRGQAVLGKDGYGIVPCGQEGQKIMEVAPEAQPFLDKFLAGGAREFFVEAEAEPAAGGHLRVLRFHRLYTEGPGCNAPMGSMRFAAFGTEPFWAAIDAGDALRLERPGAEPLVAQPRTMREEAGTWIVEGETGSGAMALRLSPGFCSDGMSDSLYAWTAQVQLPGGEALKGCGFRGSEAEKK